MARSLQATLIPPALPSIAGLDIGAIYRPAGTGEEVGGDFYDAFQIAVDDWVAVIGDVCGKGVDAAVVTALTRYTCRAASVEHDDPSRVLEIINEVLLHNDNDRHCSAAVVRLRRIEQGWTATISLAGHPPALLRSSVTGALTEFGTFGSLLGIFPEPSFFVESCVLGPGDVLALYTDGVTEARRGDEFFGEQRLHRVLLEASGSAQQLADSVLESSLEFQLDRPRDDIAVVVLRVP